MFVYFSMKLVHVRIKVTCNFTIPRSSIDNLKFIPGQGWVILPVVYKIHVLFLSLRNIVIIIIEQQIQL